MLTILLPILKGKPEVQSKRDNDDEPRQAATDSGAGNIVGPVVKSQLGKLDDGLAKYSRFGVRVQRAADEGRQLANGCEYSPAGTLLGVSGRVTKKPSYVQRQC